MREPLEQVIDRVLREAYPEATDTEAVAHAIKDALFTDGELEDDWAVEWEYARGPRLWCSWGKLSDATRESLGFRDADLANGRTTGRIAPLYVGQPETVESA